ncbi:MAG TPA: hypothetical protein VGE07_14270, partial [Herpetosiphonaceae bacterium]
MSPITYLRWRRLLRLAGCALLLLAGFGRSAAQDQPSRLLIRELVPGPGDARPILLASTGDKVFFMAEVAPGGWELWVTDATSSGTLQLTNMLPDPEYPRTWIGGSAAFEGGLAFARQTDAGFEFWRSDGTPAGTRMILAVPGQGPQGSMTVIDGALYFFSQDHGQQTNYLWRSDGTAAGTATVASLPNPSNYSSADVRQAGGELYAVLRISDYPSRTGRFLYKHFDGAGFTDLAACEWAGYVICPPAGAWRDSFVVGHDNPARLQFNQGAVTRTLDLSSRSLREIVGFAGTDQYLLFGAETDDDRYQIWRTDGTPAGTRALATLGPRPGDVLGPFAAANGLVYFLFRDDEGPATELWQSDGTAAGTRRVADAAQAASASLQSTPAGLLFSGYDAAHGAELWHIPAANARPAMIHDVEPGPGSSLDGGPDV